MFRLKSFFLLPFVTGALLCGGCTTTSAPTDTATQTTGNIADVSSGFVSSSSPGSDYGDSLAKVDVFVRKNYHRLRIDIASGGGEYLAALATLLEIPPDRQGAFFAFSREHYSHFFPSAGTAPGEFLARFRVAVNSRFSSRQG